MECSNNYDINSLPLELYPLIFPTSDPIALGRLCETCTQFNNLINMTASLAIPILLYLAKNDPSKAIARATVLENKYAIGRELIKVINERLWCIPDEKGSRAIDTLVLCAALKAASKLNPTEKEQAKKELEHLKSLARLQFKISDIACLLPVLETLANSIQVPEQCAEIYMGFLSANVTVTTHRMGPINKLIHSWAANT